MWDDLRVQVRGELRSLRDQARLVIDRADAFRREPPDAWDLAAIGGLLHSHYVGVERVFRAIAADVDGWAPTGERWHADLLDMMRTVTPARSAVISKDLAASLGQYLGFRHVFRSSYPRQLDWKRIAPLVDDLERVDSLFALEITEFLESLGA